MREPAWCELWDGRPTATRDMVASLSAGPDIYSQGWHLCEVWFPCRVVGYHFAGEAIPTGSNRKDWRLWIQRSDPRTGLPTGDPEPNSDLIRYVNPSNASQSRDSSMQVAISTTLGGSATPLRYVDFLLPNAVILSPGSFWIGIARTGLFGSEKYYGSWLSGRSKGMRDLMNANLFDTLEEIDPRAITSLDYGNALNDQVFIFPDNDPSVMDLCNIDISLIMEKPRNE